jgi:dihydrofolate reductase
MRRIVVVEHLSLDGVMQSPSGQGEDRRGGFTHGGWAQPDNDEVMAAELGGDMGTVELLFGRFTYEQFHGYWPKQTEPNPFTDVLNNTQKYVASRTLTDPLPWINSTLLSGDAADAVRELKGKPGKDLVVLGSGNLVRSLIRAELVDHYQLLIHPVVLGSGQRLFPDDGPFSRLRLAKSVVTTTGVVIATYEAVRHG